MDNKKVIGIYHKDCTDGTTAAAVLLKKFPSIKLFPIGHSDTKDDLAKIKEVAKEGAEIYFVDIVYSLEELLNGSYKITVIDHHIGDKEKIEKLANANDNLTFIFDNNKSGASLAWTYLFPDEEMPEIIKYVEDSDLWKGEFEDTKYVVNYLSTNASSPEQTLELIENGDIESIKEKGKIISDYTSVQMDRFVKNAKSIDLRIGEIVIPSYNLTTSEYASAVGHKLSTLNERATVMFSINGDSVKFSFRSKDGQSPSALELAKELGGGGHENAAGAGISLKDFLKML